MDKTRHIEHGDQIGAKSLPHVEHDIQERRMRPERFREWYQEGKSKEIVPASDKELWSARLIMTTLKGRAYPSEIYDCLHLVSYWDNAHPWLFKDSTTDDQREQLTKLYSQAMSNYNTHVKELYSDKSAIEFKDSAEAYINHYFEVIDYGKIILTHITDVSKHKPFGHLLFSEIEALQTTPEALMDRYKDDRETQMFIATSAYSGEPGVYRYHTEGLRELLLRRDNPNHLKAANWSTDPDGFARHDMIQKIAPPKTELGDITDDAYGYSEAESGEARLHVLYSIHGLLNQIEER